MARNMSYLENLMREAKQTAGRVSNAVDKKLQSDYEEKYNRRIGNNIGSSNVREQVGQLVGALVQGRRYDDNTGKQVTAMERKVGRPAPVERKVGKTKAKVTRNK